MFNKIGTIYGKIVKILNIIFCILFFIPANIISGFYFLVAIGAVNRHFSFDVGSFFTTGSDLLPGGGDIIVLLFYFPAMFILIYLICVVLPANFLYLPIYFKQIKSGEFFLQKINFKNIFLKEPIHRRFIASFVIIEIFNYCFTFLFLLFYFIHDDLYKIFFN